MITISFQSEEGFGEQGNGWWRTSKQFCQFNFYIMDLGEVQEGCVLSHVLETKGHLVKTAQLGPMNLYKNNITAPGKLLL